MGMSAEDFGAVLAELTQATQWADRLEQDNPQEQGRWWFSIRTHAASVFLSKEYFEYETARKNKEKRSHRDLLARDVWFSTSFSFRPELRFWILEALGLLKDPEATYTKLQAIAKNTDRCGYLKTVVDWSEIEDKAREGYDRLVSDSVLQHRPHS